MQAIVRLPQPVIAAVQGIATAAGCQLVASCDLAVAASDGAVRNAGRQYRAVLLDADGRAVAQHAAQARDGDAADRRHDLGRGGAAIGLVNRVVAPGTERGEAIAAGKIASKSALTVKIGKEAFYRQLEMSLAEAYRYTAEVMVENMLRATPRKASARSSTSERRSEESLTHDPESGNRFSDKILRRLTSRS